MGSSRDKKKKPSDRKNSWVMLAQGSGYTPLPGETTLYQSPPRTTLSLQSPSRSTPSESYSLQCKSGVIYLTNRRVRLLLLSLLPSHRNHTPRATGRILMVKLQIIYLPLAPTPALTSFAVPILNVSDSRVTAPWFGANKWEAAITPVYNGGIPPVHSSLELTMEFKEGGAFDFATTFERLRERLRHAVDVAASVGDGVQADARGAGPLAGVNLGGVHLEDLPAYEERAGAPTSVGRGSVGTQGTGSTVAGTGSEVGSPRAEGFAPPLEPPPGYEEVQRGGVADELERRLRGSV